MKKRQCKRVALFLLLVLLIPFAPIVPVSHVFAAGGSPFPFDYPSTDSFYPVDFVIRLSGTGHVMYMRVRTDTGQKIASWQGIFDLYTIATTPDPFSKYTFYDDVGNVVDSPFASSSENLELIRSDSDSHQTDTYGIVIASNADLYTYPYGGSLADGDSELYFYRNYVSLAVTPTPTPTPEPEIDTRFPNFINAYRDNILNSSNRSVTKYLVAIRYYDETNLRYEFRLFVICQRFDPRLFGTDPLYTPNYNGYSYSYPTLTVDFPNVAPNHDYTGIYIGNSPYIYYDNLDDVYVDYDCSNFASSYPGFQLNNPGGGRDYTLTVDDDGLFYEATAVYLINSDGTTTRVDGDGSSTPTPTPNPSPTLAPQPTTEPTVEPPDEGDDGNWTGLFGWIKKLINALLSIPLKIANGILNALKYVFVPDMNKIKSLWSTLNTKFGIQKPVLFEFDPVLWNNPENVVMHFNPISLNGEETESIDVTIIDFDQVDDWLESEPGQIMIRIIQAVFSLTMWGYMIYIFRKHIATINYTDADTLTDPDTWHKGGDD